MKPTTGGPLAIFLAAHRDWRAALLGVALGGLIALAGMLAIFARTGDLSAERIVAVITGNHSHFSHDPEVSPQINRGRIDVAANLEYLAGRSLPTIVGAAAGLLFIAVTAGTLWMATRSSDSASAASATSALAIVATLFSIYHNIYDAPPLCVPIASCLVGRHASWRATTPARRWLLGGLLLVPFVNVFWTDGFQHVLSRWGGFAASNLQRFSELAGAANGIALFGAWLVLLGIVGSQREGVRSCV